MSALPVLHEHDLVLHCAGSREALHSAITSLYRTAADRIAAADPQRIDNSTGEFVDRVWFVAFGEHVEDVTVRQHRFYRGPVLKQIAEQAPGGWTRDAWHALFKRELLGHETVREKVAGRKRLTVYRRLRSTRDLSVRQMSNFIDEVIALMVSTYGVEFVFDIDEREAVRWKPARKKAPPTTTPIAAEVVA